MGRPGARSEWGERGDVSELSGAERIAKERQRQVDREGWSDAHDDEHSEGEMALVAALYATPIPLLERRDYGPTVAHFVDPWPATWDEEWDKREPRSTSKRGRRARIRELEKAGALIAAEIDRLLRAEKGTP